MSERFDEYDSARDEARHYALVLGGYNFLLTHIGREVDIRPVEREDSVIACEAGNEYLVTVEHPNMRCPVPHIVVHNYQEGIFYETGGTVDRDPDPHTYRERGRTKRLSAKEIAGYVTED